MSNPDRIRFPSIEMPNQVRFAKGQVELVIP